MLISTVNSSHQLIQSKSLYFEVDELTVVDYKKEVRCFQICYKRHINCVEMDNLDVCVNDIVFFLIDCLWGPYFVSHDLRYPEQLDAGHPEVHGDKRKSSQQIHRSCSWQQKIVQWCIC